MQHISEQHVLIASAWAVAAIAGVLALQRWRSRAAMRSRLAALQLSSPQRPRGWSPRRVDLRLSVSRLGKPIVNRLGIHAEKWTRLIESGGLNGKLTLAELVGWQIVLAVTGLLTGVLHVAVGIAGGPVLMPVLAVFGFLTPVLWLKKRGADRRNQLSHDMPTVIDLLALGLAAGMGLDRAMSIVCERVPSPLTDELRVVLQDISLGISREAAFDRLAQRAPYEDVRALSRSIVQSEQLGTSLVSTVQNQARQIRITRRRRAEAQAMQAPIKMLFPMVAFILPTLFLVVLGPPGLKLAEALTRGHP